MSFLHSECRSTVHWSGCILNFFFPLPMCWVRLSTTVTRTGLAADLQRKINQRWREPVEAWHRWNSYRCCEIKKQPLASLGMHSNNTELTCSACRHVFLSVFWDPGGPREQPHLEVLTRGKHYSLLLLRNESSCWIHAPIPVNVFSTQQHDETMNMILTWNCFFCAVQWRTSFLTTDSIPLMGNINDCCISTSSHFKNNNNWDLDEAQCHNDVVRMCFSGRAAGFAPRIICYEWQQSNQPRIWTQVELISSLQPWGNPRCSGIRTRWRTISYSSVPLRNVIFRR